MISVVIPARDAAELLGGCLDGLAAQEGDFEVIVVDDGSADGTAELAERHPLRPQVLRLPGGGGPGLARAAGAQAARGDVLAFTDADCVPQPGWLAAGQRCLDAGADFVQGRTVPPDNVIVGPFDRALWVTGAWGLYESANLFVRRAVYEAAGGFDAGIEAREERFLGGRAPAKHLAEDVWFGWRVRRSGARMAFCEAALVHHAVFPRDAFGFVAERRRLRHFPLIARQVPELREVFFHRRWFLNDRSARFDAALVGVALAHRFPPALLLALPYARRLRDDARGWQSARIAAVFAVADAVAFASLLEGSLRHRSPLL